MSGGVVQHTIPPIEYNGYIERKYIMTFKLVPELAFLPQDDKEKNLIVRAFWLNIRIVSKLLCVIVPAVVVIGVVGGLAGS